MENRIIKDFIPTGRRNRPGKALIGPRYITIHDTANTSKGANAKAHAAYLKSDAAANAPVSWHFTVDDTDIIQHLPITEVGWHAGDGASGVGNNQSIGIEICENADGNRAKAEGNAVALVAYLLRKLNIPLENVVQHNKWTGKNCPNVIRNRHNGWDIFVRGVQVQLDVLAQEDKSNTPPVAPSGTPILGPAQCTVEHAIQWAISRGAHLRFIEAAEYYWEYGEKFGIRPEVLYAQAAKETNFGKYTGVVKPEQYNWAGIKTATATGDRPEDHETFANPKDGVRAHFNHICAYVGKEPLKPVHPRYGVVMSLSWAGTVRTVEELGAKWAPNSDYGNSIVRDYLTPMLAGATPPPKPAEPPVTEEPIPSQPAGDDQLRDDLINILEYALATLKPK